MIIIYILIFISLMIAIIFLLSFIWAVKNGQYEDVVTPSIRVLFDEQKTINKKQ